MNAFAPNPRESEAVCSPGFAPLLRTLGLSVAVSSYQSGKLVLLRGDSDGDGDTLNTHYCEFARPTGLALRGRRLAVGTMQAIQEFHDHPQLAEKLEPAGRHDACYLPLVRRTTGDIEVHELGYAADGRLWFVNTRFSALCTLSDDYSFQVQWQPPFISALVPEDRCHLNGLGFIDGRPALATALGHGDSHHAWRGHRLDGGVLMDVRDNRLIAEGLCLPHSPRWHDGRLWLLNSGKGQLATVDPDSGRLEVVVELPGFTRGLAFHGPYAFVGTSAVRDSETETGPIPIGECVAETLCGVWVIDTRNGEIAAWLRFTQVVNMLFSVLLLPAQRFPALITDNDERIRHAFLLPPTAVGDGGDEDAGDLGTLFESAKDRHREGDVEQAEALYRRVLAAAPDRVDAHLLLSRLLQDSGRPDEAIEAIELIERAVSRQPDSADLQEALGLAQANAGQLEAAVVSWGRAVLLDRQRVETWQVLGQALRSLGRMADAAAAFDRALALQPDHVQALIGKGDALVAQAEFDAALEVYQRAMQRFGEAESVGSSKAELADLHGRIGEALQGLGRLDEAATELERAVELKPEFYGAHNRLGDVCRSLGDAQRASRSFAQALRLEPDDAAATHNLGLALKDLGQAKRAMTCFVRALELTPDNPVYLNSYAVAIIDDRRYQEAEQCFRRAIDIAPEYGDAWNNLSALLGKTRRLDESLSAVHRALELNPDSVEAYNNLGTTQQAFGDAASAIESFEHALKLDPEMREAQANLAYAQLLGGDFENGWRNYEFRLDHERRRIDWIKLNGPRWDGADPNGRRLLLQAEQGLGDSIQFIRYARRIAAAGGRVSVRCQTALVRLFAAMPEVEQVVAGGDAVPDFDAYALLPSLPYLLRDRVPDIPAETPYLGLPADIERPTLDADAFKVGIVWAGNPEHGNDANRSVSLDRFLPLAWLPGTRLYSLQVGERREDLQSSDGTGAGAGTGTDVDAVVDLGGGFGDFADTAAAMMELDLIIGVDTAIVHLAGALARPVWTLLPYAPDWRWMKDRDDSPWYPSMRLFRQPELGDWDSVFREVMTALMERFRSRSDGRGRASTVLKESGRNPPT